MYIHYLVDWTLDMSNEDYSHFNLSNNLHLSGPSVKLMVVFFSNSINLAEAICFSKQNSVDILVRILMHTLAQYKKWNSVSVLLTFPVGILQTAAEF